ncbi:MAG TPA: HYR domain-containing protein, partial [Chitinophagaceae bacterium]|nr:HYR domain-containing protein [Chitinophagaceae bacterium]
MKGLALFAFLGLVFLFIGQAGFAQVNPDSRGASSEVSIVAANDANLPVSPQVVARMNQEAICTTWSGSAGPGDPSTPVRSFRDGVASSCGNPGPCTSPISGSGLFYDQVSWTNPVSTTQCITVSFTNTATNFGFITAYSAPVNLSNLCQNYMGDLGSSALAGQTLTFGVNVPGNATVYFFITNVTANAAASYTVTVDAPLCAIPFTNCAQNFDGVTAPALPTGWTASTGTTCGGSNPWATTTAFANSSPNSAWTNDPNCISDEYLDSRVFPIVSSTAQLSFRQRYQLETSFDGMVLEISIGGGPFQDILVAGGTFAAGGYNGTISVNFGSPIAGRQAWTGTTSGAFTTTTVNLPAAANGQNVVIRWRRATDNSVSGAGVWIDDITLSGSDCPGSCTVTCPANMTVNADPGQCGAVVNFPTATTNGQCGPVTMTPASGSFFPVGTTQVRANTFSGPTCTFNITVVDNQPPSITCPANIVRNNDPGVCGAVVTFAATASDNCPGVTVSYSPASGSTFPVGTTTVTATARDAAGNTATCTFTVTVNDTEPPTFSNPYPQLLYYKFDGSGTTVPNLASNPPAGTANATLVGQTQGSTGKCGGALVGTGGPGAGNHLNTNWNVALPAQWSIMFWLGPNQVDLNPSYLFGALSAGSFRAFYGGAAGPNNVLVRGGSGDVLITGVNPAATFITIVYNGTNTVVYRNGANPTTYNVTFNNVGSTPLYVGAYNTTAATSAMNGRLDEFGLFNRALTAGEVAQLYNNCPTTASSCPSNITVNNTPGQCGAVVTYNTPVGSDNCPGATTTQIAGLPSGSFFPVGTTTNTFRATDASGNQTNCTFTVTVVDNQPPTITCPANITVPSTLGLCTAPVNYTITAADNCPGVTTAMTAGLASGSLFPLGTTTVTWRATDASGNTSTCSFTVTVTDVQLPVISSQPQGRNACLGDNVTFSVTAAPLAGPNNLTYQWQVFNGTTWVNVPGATSSGFTVNNVTLAMNHTSYRVIVTGPCTTVTSNVATLNVNPLPIVSIVSSRPPVVRPGETVNFTVVGNPSGGSVVWRRDNQVITGATSLTLS